MVAKPGRIDSRTDNATGEDLVVFSENGESQCISNVVSNSHESSLLFLGMWVFLFTVKVVDLFIEFKQKVSRNVWSMSMSLFHRCFPFETLLASDVVDL